MDTLVLKNVFVHCSDAVSPTQLVHVRVQDGIITALGPQELSKDGEVVDLRGAHVSPGWIDLHTHIYYGGTDMGLKVEEVGLATGVHVLADAGSAGEANFAGFRAYVASSSESIKAFINLGSIGLVAGNRVKELFPEGIYPERLSAVIEENRDLIKGVKVRLSGTVVGHNGLHYLQLAQGIARATALPLVIHVGEPPPNLEAILTVVEPGSLITHCYHGKGDNSLLTEALRQRAKECAKRGVLFDVGHGRASFSYKTARLCLEDGFYPFSISTDLHVRNVQGPVWDLPTTMTKLLNVGMDLEQVITCVTRNPAQFLGEPERGRVEPGQPAHLTIFEVRPSRVELPDSGGELLRMDRVIVPVAVVSAGAYRPVDHARLPSPIYRC